MIYFKLPFSQSDASDASALMLECAICPTENALCKIHLSLLSNHYPFQ